MLMNLIILCLLLLLIVQLESKEQNNKIALIITLAGNNKLSEYFEWGCRSIYHSKEIIDLFVFHENNQRLRQVTCAANVKFINVGDRGMASLIVKHIVSGGNANSTFPEDIEKELSLTLGNILLHSPKYLVEVKPMLGDLFQNYISSYSHWGYTDPDILWGNMTEWIEPNDFEDFDVLSFAKHWDASRLYLRGQFTFFRNMDRINHLWKELEYFSHKNYATRMGTAYRMFVDRVPSDQVFKKSFHSAEGWFSQLIFKKNQFKVKISGRAFDDFYREPVVLFDGRLYRCSLQMTITACIKQLQLEKSSPENITSIFKLPPAQFIEVKSYKDPMACKMFWLPIEARECIADPKYNKEVALVQDAQTEVKMLRTGESAYEAGKWYVNDEMAASRQVRETAAFFHFRHWDDFVATSLATTWHSKSDTTLHCMVLYLRIDKALAFEDCDAVITKESSGKIILERAPQMIAGDKVDSVTKILSYFRKELEVGSSSGGSGSTYSAPLSGGKSKSNNNRGASRSKSKSKSHHKKGKKPHRA